jgi:dolichol-phosphate mannosyltransferase
MLPAAAPSAGQGELRVSAVLPVFAERGTVAEIARGLVELVGGELHEIILVVAARAPAETREICREVEREIACARFSEQRENPGLGLGVRQGIAEARGTHVLLMDSDGEMDVRTVPAMVDALKRERADMVVASRWMRGGGVEGYDPLKYWLNRAFQLLFRILYRTRVHDLTLGFKLCRADLFQSLPWDSQFHDIGCETTMRPIRAGARVAEVPTVWVRRKEGESSNPFRRNFRYVHKALAILFDPRHPTLERLERLRSPAR